jgi:hypothetical protein
MAGEAEVDEPLAVESAGHRLQNLDAPLAVLDQLVVGRQDARDAALDVARSAARLGEERLNQLTEERRPLERELEFYQGKPVPPKLLSQMEAIDTAARAQKVVAQTQKAEIDRVQQMYDAELVHLKGLWSGQIAPGTPMAASAPARPAASAAATGRPRP